MKRRFSLLLMMLMLITHGIKAGLYFEYEGKHYVVDYEVGGTIDMVAGKWHYYPVIYSAALCAPSIPFSYEGVITVPETVYFPGADFEYDGYQVHAEPIPSLEVTGCTQNAFESCPGLIKVIFPEPRPQEGKLYGWGVSFKGCISLKTVENMDLSTILAHQFDLCSSLIDIDLSKTGKIEEFAFCGCSSLKELKFRGPTIMKYAFGRCSGLETISFEISPVLHDEAFAESNKIKKVISKSKQPYAFDDNVFTQTVYENALLVVPEGSVETYKATNGWKNFYNIVEEGSEPSIDPAPSPGPDPSTDSQPYAVYNNNTLTFYCDNQRSSREGTTYDLRQDLNERALPPKWFKHNELITKAIFDASFANARPTTTYGWFHLCQSLKEIQGISNLNTSEVTIMSGMFNSCSSLTSLDVSKFNTSNLKEMTGMFYACSSLTRLDVSNFNTSNVTSMGQMFSGCSSLTDLDLSKFNTSNVVDMYRLFYGCSSLTCIIMGSQFTSNESTDATELFYGCSKLSKVTFTGDIPASINSKFFEGVGTADAPAILDVPEQYKANYAAKFDGNKFYGGYFKLNGSDVNPPIAEAEPYVVYDDGVLTFYCDNQRSSRQGTTYELNVGEEEPGWYENQSNVNKVVFDSSFASARPTTGHEWFDDCISLTEIEGMEYLNTSEMTLMDEMFFSCSNLNSVDLIHFDTNKVTDMRAMFSGCSGLRSIDLSHFNTSNVESVGAMFYGCSGLTEIDLSNFDTSKARSINYIFRECTNLKEVTFGQQFVSNEYAWVEDEFKGCANIKTVKFTGDIPASINSKFFEGVGTAVAPATLVVPEQYKANYQAKFDGKMFYGGYFTLEGVVFKKGDLNGDGEVNNVDLVNVLTLIMNGKYETNADLNGDGVVNVADVVELVKIINSDNGTGSGYFWMGNYMPKSNTFPTINGKEVEGIVTTYTSLDDAMAKASRTYVAGEYAIVMYPSSWGTKDVLVFLDSATMKYYVAKQKDLSDFPDYLYYESTEKIGANTTITLSTESLAKAAGATLSSLLIK